MLTIAFRRLEFLGSRVAKDLVELPSVLSLALVLLACAVLVAILRWPDFRHQLIIHNLLHPSSAKLTTHFRSIIGQHERHREEGISRPRRHFP